MCVETLLCVMLVFPVAIKLLARQSSSSRIRLYPTEQPNTTTHRKVRAHKEDFQLLHWFNRDKHTHTQAELRGSIRETGGGGRIYSLGLKSLSCRVYLSTMACLFVFNKAYMNGNSHQLMEMQGDKQGRAERERRDEGRKRRRGGLGRKRGFFFLAVGGLSVLENYAKQSLGKRKTMITLFLCLFAQYF